MARDNVFLYRQEAERLRRAAESIMNAELRRQYLDVALQYDQLADSVIRMRGGPGRLSAEEHDFHRSEAYRLRALAKTITTKAIKERVLKQAQQHGRLVGLRLED